MTVSTGPAGGRASSTSGSLGFGGFWSVATVIVLSIVLASSLNVSAFNVGITAGPWLGGLALGAVSVRGRRVLVP